MKAKGFPDMRIGLVKDGQLTACSVMFRLQITHQKYRLDSITNNNKLI